MLFSIQRSRSCAVVAAGVAVLSLALAACGSSGGADGHSGSGGGSSASAVDTAVFGTPHKATGSPIVIGINNPGKSDSVDTSTENAASRALVKYANAYLGGINGHVIKLRECDTQDTPAKEIDCANQAVKAKVSAIVQATGDDPTITTATKAGTPVFDGVTSSQVGLSAKGAFSMGNSVADFGAMADYAKQHKITKGAMFVIDVPGASGPAKKLAPAFFKNAGGSLTVTAIAPGTADLTPQVQTQQSKNPGLYYVVGDPTFCSSALKAIKTLSSSTPTMILDTCISQKSSAIPGGYAGLKTITATPSDPKDKDYQLFTAIQKKYNGATDNQALFGYAPLLGLIRVLNAAKITDTSPAGTLKAIQTAPAVPLPLGHGAKLRCDGTAVSLSKNICAAAIFVADTAEDGALSNFKALDDSSIYQIGH